MKEKSKATAFGGGTNKRWFEIERTSPTDELILCYYKGPPSNERRDKRGWIFINDIASVDQDAVCRWITIQHPTRTFRLQALDRANHHQWFQELSNLCSNGNSSSISNSSSSSEDTQDDGHTGTLKRKDEDEESKASSSPEHESTAHLDMSKAETEIDFLRQINGVHSPREVTNMDGSPRGKVSNVRHPEKGKTKQRMTPRVERKCITLQGKDRTKGSPFAVNGEPVNKRIGRAIERSKIIKESSVDDLNTKREKDDNNNDSILSHHKNRMILDNLSSSSSSDDSDVKETSLLTNKSFADLEQLTSPGGLDKFLVETHRASLLPDDADSPPQQKIAYAHSSPKNTSLNKMSPNEKTPKKTKTKYNGYIHPGLTPDKNFATEEWDDSSSSEDSFGGVY